MMQELDDAVRKNAEQSVRNLIAFIGENASRDGLKDTPSRVLKAYKEMFSGYGQSPNELLKEFEPVGYTGMVVVRGVDFFSTCEHHMLPFYGKAHVGYLPGISKKIVGLSKLARLVDVYARRLQVQERLTQQVVDAIQFSPMNVDGAMCVVEARHLCMACRGARKPGARMVTSSLSGEFNKPEVRAEFLQLAGVR